MSSLCRNGKLLSEIKSEKGSVAIEFFSTFFYCTALFFYWLITVDIFKQRLYGACQSFSYHRVA